MASHRTIAQKIVEAILNEQSGRRGFRQNWEGIDEEIKRECMESWVKLTTDILHAEVEGGTGR
jgi:hypothetical protein